MVTPVVLQFSGKAGDFGRERAFKSGGKNFAFFSGNVRFCVDTKLSVSTIAVA
jgi:hypothetical protein